MENLSIISNIHINVSNQEWNNSMWNESYEYEHGDNLGFIHGLYLFAIPIIASFGIGGNLCSFKVFVFTYFNRQPSSIYLAALSISDTLFLIALLVGWFGSLNEHLLQSGVWCIFAVYITYVTSCLSVWYLVLVMLDRYIVICHSLHGPKLCSRRRSLLALSIVTSFAVLFYSHCFFTNKIIYHPSGPTCTWRESFLDIITIFTYLDTAITFVIPFFVILILNVFILFSIRRFKYRHISRYEKKYYASPCNCISKAQFRLTIMLIVVSVVFLVLNLPSHGIRFYILVNHLAATQNIALFISQQICQMLYYLNFSINFLLYFSRSKQFRRYVTEPIKCRRQ